MKLWFLRNKYKEAAVQILNVENLNLDNPRKGTSEHLSLPEEFRVSIQSTDNSSTSLTRTEYISIFLIRTISLPDIFGELKKIVVRMMTSLSERLVRPPDPKHGGKINGAKQFCPVKLGQLRSYLGEKGFDQNSCAWMSGCWNVIDLVRWRELGLTQT
ncbi:hypothetical protein K1719_035677 [Acacia pycnantha]|nr:hypothetical protein K1719_035677 [Acacia pycnantha]